MISFQSLANKLPCK